MVELRPGSEGQNLNQRIIALRIGGNDLMGCLGLRRNPATTLYNTPMGYVIPMLAGVMGRGLPDGLYSSSWPRLVFFRRS